MKVFYSPRYEVSLPGHIWPTSKYRLIAERLGIGGPERSALQRGGNDGLTPTGGRPGLVGPAFSQATWDDLALVHTGEYLEKLRTSTLLQIPCATIAATGV